MVDDRVVGVFRKDKIRAGKAETGDAMKVWGGCLEICWWDGRDGRVRRKARESEEQSEIKKEIEEY